VKLAPIERPPGLRMRIAYWLGRRRFGKVPTALKVIYARAPKLSMLGYRQQQVVEKGLSLERELVLLIEAQSSLLNDCGFCKDLHRAQAVQARIGLEKWSHLLDYASSPHYSDRERAALAWCEEITRTRRAGDAAFEALRKHFDERQIVEITWLNALGNYYNLMAVPLGLESDELTALALSRAGGST